MYKSEINMEDDEPNQILLFPQTKRERAKLFFKNYWRLIVIILIPTILFPIAYIEDGKPFKTLYIFLVTAVYLVADVLPTCVTALVPIALSTFLGLFDSDFHMTQVYLRTELLECLGIMTLMVAIEQSQVHKRLALKILMVFGCCHYRLSFLLFFATMFLSMWMSNTISCGIMIPLVKAILNELEKMGILEMYLSIDQELRTIQGHNQSVLRPTEYTVFYFLGIAYSASIGGMGTLSGSPTNKIFKVYCETLFPNGPKIEFPHFMLLNLPGVLLMESLFYMWMNFYFLGMFRGQSDIALQVGLTEEEAEFINALLRSRYNKLGKMKFHGYIVSCMVGFAVFIQILDSALSIDDFDFELEGAKTHIKSLKLTIPTLISAILLFMIPTELKHIKRSLMIPGAGPQFPTVSTRPCLNWKLVSENVEWSVLLIVAGSCALFDQLMQAGSPLSPERLLAGCRHWPAPAQVLALTGACKALTEFAPNECVVQDLLPGVAKLSIESRSHPHYLMLAATLASSLPFHLATGCPANAMVLAYGHIPPWRMMCAGVVPTVIAVVVTWFTVTVWSKAIWTDITSYPGWVDRNVFADTT